MDETGSSGVWHAMEMWSISEFYGGWERRGEHTPASSDDFGRKAKSFASSELAHGFHKIPDTQFSKSNGGGQYEGRRRVINSHQLFLASYLTRGVLAMTSLRCVREERIYFVQCWERLPFTVLLCFQSSLANIEVSKMKY